MPSKLALLKQEMKKLEDPKKAEFLQRFFKTGKGEYAEGDKLLGISVPPQRKLARKYKDLPLKDVKVLLKSKFHEHRLTALFILRYQYPKNKEEVHNFLLDNRSGINNWDLVDSSAPYITGDYLLNNNRDILYKLAKSNLWDRRIAIMSTYVFIKHNDFKDTLKLCKLLLNDPHDLIHKACGWMLREIGKKDVSVLEKFLDKNNKKMPRTMLRYAIEKLPKQKRLHYMA